MGQKVNPKIFRIGTLYGWTSKWISQKNYCRFLQEDVLIKKYLKKELKEAGVDRVEIERSPNLITIIIHAAKPGLIIGRGGQGAEELKKKLKGKFLGPKVNLNVNINEVERPHLSAEIVLNQMIADIEKRIPYRRTMKQAISRVERAGALGVKVKMSGRLDGAEIARRETLTSGNLPLHTLRADIDYSRGAAHTTYGAVGIKIWIYKGEIFGRGKMETYHGKPEETEAQRVGDHGGAGKSERRRAVDRTKIDPSAPPRPRQARARGRSGSARTQKPTPRQAPSGLSPSGRSRGL